MYSVFPHVYTYTCMRIYVEIHIQSSMCVFMKLHKHVYTSMYINACIYGNTYKHLLLIELNAIFAAISVARYFHTHTHICT